MSLGKSKPCGAAGHRQTTHLLVHQRLDLSGPVDDCGLQSLHKILLLCRSFRVRQRFLTETNMQQCTSNALPRTVQLAQYTHSSTEPSYVYSVANSGDLHLCVQRNLAHFDVLLHLRLPKAPQLADDRKSASLSVAAFSAGLACRGPPCISHQHTHVSYI